MWVPEATWKDDDGEFARALAWLGTRGDFFDPEEPLFLSRAPGRLDLMGGIADYSGSLVLELPIAAATWVAAQASDDPSVSIESEGMKALDLEERVTLPLDAVVPAQPLDYPRARKLLIG